MTDLSGLRPLAFITLTAFTDLFPLKTIHNKMHLQHSTIIFDRAEQGQGTCKSSKLSTGWPHREHLCFFVLGELFASSPASSPSSCSSSLSSPVLSESTMMSSSSSSFLEREEEALFCLFIAWLTLRARSGGKDPRLLLPLLTGSVPRVEEEEDEGGGLLRGDLIERVCRHPSQYQSPFGT
jgi:hypothetical protein